MDVLTKEQRRRNMQNIRPKDTRIKMHIAAIASVRIFWRKLLC